MIFIFNYSDLSDNKGLKNKEIPESYSKLENLEEL